jgi:hypothetical protein
MKIYISLPIDFDKKDYKNFNQGIVHLKKMGHNVLDFSDYNVTTKENVAKLFTQYEKSLKDTEIVVAEVSNPDSKVGYEIAKAFSEKKFVIALEKDSTKIKINPIVHGNSSKNMIYSKYNEKNIGEVIEKTVKEATKRLDSKFILIISPEIDRYLDWSSSTKRMHKAQVVRNALDQMMKKDRDYKNYLNS